MYIHPPKLIIIGIPLFMVIIWKSENRQKHAKIQKNSQFSKGFDKRAIWSSISFLLKLFRTHQDSDKANWTHKECF